MKILSVNSKLPDNTKLIDLLAQRKTATRDEQQNLLNLIAEETVMHADFLLLAKLSKPPVVKDGRPMLQKDTQLSFLMVEGNGKHYFPLFTDKEEMTKLSEANPDASLVQMNFDDVSYMIVVQGGAEGFVINPFNGGPIIERSIVEAWRRKKQISLTGHSERIIRKDTQINIIPPDPPLSAELEAALKEAAEKCEGLKSLWMRGMILDGQKSYLAVIDYEGDRQTVFDAIGSAARPFLRESGAVELNIVPLNEKNPNAPSLGKKASEGNEPLFTRS